MTLDHLPDTAALRHLSDALWGRGGRGAAVLVGAGFSRQAEFPEDDAHAPPLWGDLADAMRCGLGAGPSAGWAGADALRVAEAYETMFGREALIRLLRDLVADEAWRPGEGHRLLLDLPWSDVLTTNYDTLLERAAPASLRAYGVVRHEHDLAGAGSPRIVKLHGTIEDGSGLVVTEEDYRRYPDRRAAMVNTARQVLIENDLCLLGFSGDDPNFRAWAGWVRDRLHGRHRKIYLVGALDLDTVSRRVLERMDVVPIDLGPAIEKDEPDRRGLAVRRFLRHLASCRQPRPSEWKPLSASEIAGDRTLGKVEAAEADNARALGHLRESVVAWQRDREAYPGWLICPRGERMLLRFGTDEPAALSRGLDTMSEDEAAEALMEIAWRHDVAAYPLPPRLAERLKAAATLPRLRSAPPSMVRAVLSTLLRAAREASEGFDDLVRWFEPLGGFADARAAIAHHRALDAVDRLDFAAVTELSGRVAGDDPIWHLRRAALLYWLGQEQDGLEAARTAWRETLARCQRAPDSVALQSRLTWIAFVLPHLGPFSEDAPVEIPERFRLDGYDPWADVREQDRDVEKLVQEASEARGVRLSFEAGNYRARDGGVRFVAPAASVTPRQELAWFAERTGVPLRADWTDFLAGRMEQAVIVSDEPSATSVGRALATHPTDKGLLMTRWLSRLGIASLDAEDHKLLSERCEAAVAHWRERLAQSDDHLGPPVERLALFTEILGRLAIRDDPPTARRHVDLALSLASDPVCRSHLVEEPTNTLLIAAAEAVPPEERGALTEPLVRYPLSGERKLRRDTNVERILRRFAKRPSDGEAFRRRIAALTARLHGDAHARTEAASRLYVLARRGVLSNEERASFAEALWRPQDCEGDVTPGDTYLYPHVFLDAPAPDGIDREARVRAVLLRTLDDVAAQAELLAEAIAPVSPALALSPAEAGRLFDRLASWRPRPTPDEGSSVSPLGRAFGAGEEKRRKEKVAGALGNVAWHLQAEGTSARLNALLRFVDETGLRRALGGLPPFLASDETRNTQIIGRLRSLLRHGTFEDASTFALAVRSMRTKDQPVPRELIEGVVWVLPFHQASGLHVLLNLAAAFVGDGALGDEQREDLAASLDGLIGPLDYGTLAGENGPHEPFHASASLARAAAVRLAAALCASGVESPGIRRWLEAAETDPLPEVRHALHRSQDSSAA